MERLQMEIDGMTCGHCVGVVKRALAGLDDVSIVSVSVGRADVAYDASKAGAQTILETVSGAGYPARATAGAS